MGLLNINVCLLTDRNVITYREVTVSVNKTNAMSYTASEPVSQRIWTPGGFGPGGPILGGSKSAKTLVMVLNKLYDLSNDRDNLFEQNVE